MRDTAAAPDGTQGFGVSVQAGGSAEIARAAIERGHTAGVFAIDGASLRLEDAVVASTESDDAGAHGQGIDRRRLARGRSAHGARLESLHWRALPEAPARSCARTGSS